MSLFKLIKPHPYAKRGTITCPGDLYLEWDRDDVPTKRADAAARKAVRILNEHWEDDKHDHSPFPPLPFPPRGPDS